MAFKINTSTVVDNISRLTIGSTGGGVGRLVVPARTSITAGVPVVLNRDGSVSTVTANGGSVFDANTTLDSVYGSQSDNILIYNPIVKQYGFIKYFSAGTYIGYKSFSPLSGNNDWQSYSSYAIIRYSAASTTPYVRFDPNNGLGIFTYANSTVGFLKAFITYNSAASITAGTEKAVTTGSSYPAVITFNGDANNTFITFGNDTSGTANLISMYTYNANTLDITSGTGYNNIFSGYQRFIWRSVKTPVVTSESALTLGPIVSFWNSNGYNPCYTVHTVSGTTLNLLNSGTVANSMGTNLVTWGPGGNGDWNFTANPIYNPTERKFLVWTYGGSYATYAILAWNISTHTLTKIAESNFTTADGTDSVRHMVSAAMDSDGNIGIAYKKYLTGNNLRFRKVSLNWTTGAMTDIIPETTYNPTTQAWNNLYLQYDSYTGKFILAVTDGSTSSAPLIGYSIYNASVDYKNYVGIAASTVSAGANVDVAIPGTYANVQGVIPGLNHYIAANGSLTLSNTGVLAGYGVANNILLVKQNSIVG